MQVDLLGAALGRQLGHGHQMILVAVHATVGKQAEDVHRLAGTYGLVDRSADGRVGEEFAVADRLCHPGEVLIHHAPGAQVHVADLGVAHLPVRQTDIHAAAGDQSVWLSRQQTFVDRLARGIDGIEIRLSLCPKPSRMISTRGLGAAVGATGMLSGSLHGAEKGGQSTGWPWRGHESSGFSHSGGAVYTGPHFIVRVPLMLANLIEFVSNHYVLSSLFVALLILLFITETRKGWQSLSNRELTALVNSGEGVVLDVRAKKEFDAGHIVDALNIPYENWSAAQASWKSTRPRPSSWSTPWAARRNGLPRAAEGRLHRRQVVGRDFQLARRQSASGQVIMPNVVIYTTAWCPFCIRAKALLDRKGVAYEEIPVDGNPTLRAEMASKAGRTSVPQIWIGDKHVGGCDELHALERAGRLDPLLQA